MIQRDFTCIGWRGLLIKFVDVSYNLVSDNSFVSAFP